MSVTIVILLFLSVMVPMIFIALDQRRLREKRRREAESRARE